MFPLGDEDPRVFGLFIEINELPRCIAAIRPAFAAICCSEFDREGTPAETLSIALLSPTELLSNIPI